MLPICLRPRGFTLVEIAVVVFIVGLLIAAGMKLLQARAEAAVEIQTETKILIIRDSLARYLASNKRLPCPDTTNGNGPGALGFTVALPPDGVENRATAGDPTSACAAPFGVLPYQTLGLSRDAALDGWQNYFSYGVSNDATTNVDWTRSPVPVGIVGGITINDRTAAGATTPIVTNAAAVVVSHGKNGLGAFTVAGTRNSVAGGDEGENSNGDVTYFRRDRTDDTTLAGGSFDDSVSFLTNTDLFGQLVKEGSVKSTQAKLNEDFQAISEALIAMVARQSVAPMCALNTQLPSTAVLTTIGVQPTNQLDPWASPYLVVSNVPTVTGSTPPTVVFTITSSGPDKSSAVGFTADDNNHQINVATIQGKLAAAFAVKCP